MLQLAHDTLTTYMCSGPALKIGKIPMYSASPWIKSLAHTITMKYPNIIIKLLHEIQTYKIFITSCIAQG